MDEDLTLESLAERTGVTRHQLSEYMNTIIGGNFSKFINRHRRNDIDRLPIQGIQHQPWRQFYRAGLWNSRRYDFWCLICLAL